MTFNEIEKEFEELFVKKVMLIDEPDKLAYEEMKYQVEPEAIKSFLKQSFIKYLKDEVERLEGILKPIQDKEDQHRKEFDIDAERYKYNPSEANLAVMKMHEGSTSAYIGGLAWGKIQTISDQISHLEAQIKELEK